MSKLTQWVCDKCGVAGSRTEVPAHIKLHCDIVELEYIYLDLCVPCLNKVTTFIHDFMNPKREYLSEKKETAEKKKA